MVSTTKPSVFGGEFQFPDLFRGFKSPFKSSFVKSPVVATKSPVVATKSPVYVAQGSFGCFHKDLRLKCENEIEINPETVSKLMKTIDAGNELETFKIMARIDPELKYYLGPPKICKVSTNPDHVEAANKCMYLRKDLGKELGLKMNVNVPPPKITAKILENFSILVMEDGGTDLQKFAKMMFEKKNDTVDEKKNTENEMKKFWSEAHRMFLGLELFSRTGYVHNDLKVENIVYHEKKGRMNFIDFGELKTKNFLIEESENNTNQYAFRCHFTYPLEIMYLNFTRYKGFTRKNVNFKKEIIATLMLNLLLNPKLKEVGVLKNPELKLKDKVLELELELELEEVQIDKKHIYDTFHSVLDDTSTRGNFLNYEQRFLDCWNDYTETLLGQMIFDETLYKKFAKKVVDTIDSFGLGLAFLYVLVNTYQFIVRPFADDLARLFLDMMSFNLEKRIEVKDALDRYEKILDEYTDGWRQKKVEQYTFGVEGGVESGVESGVEGGVEGGVESGVEGGGTYGSPTKKNKPYKFPETRKKKIFPYKKNKPSKAPPLSKKSLSKKTTPYKFRKTRNKISFMRKVFPHKDIKAAMKERRIQIRKP
jgi:hypothetical protein